MAALFFFPPFDGKILTYFSGETTNYLILMQFHLVKSYYFFFVKFKHLWVKIIFYAIA